MDGMLLFLRPDGEAHIHVHMLLHFSFLHIQWSSIVRIFSDLKNPLVRLDQQHDVLESQQVLLH